MTPEIDALPLDQLRSLHREIGALIAERRMEVLEKLKNQMLELGVTPEEISGKKHRRKRRSKEEMEAP